ncbi:MAG TPA: TolC family protein [Cyclobacteriaceae bacterium]|jgi:outer membrane protein TolC
MNKLSILIICIISSSPVYSQERTILTLEEVVRMAKQQSTAAILAETIRENRYWQFRTYKSNYAPRLALDGTLPDFNHSVTPVVQPDGTYSYPSVNRMNSDLTLSLSQAIAPTGTQVFLNSSISRFDNLETNAQVYGGNPLEIGFSQPLFQFNQLRWDRRIEPLRYEESRRKFAEDLESISQTASNLFFDLLIAQISLDIARKNVESNDTIFKIAQGRYELGKIPENELLQLELNLMNSRQAVAESELNFETSQLRLRSYLGITDENLVLIVPATVPEFAVDEQVALQQARNNRQEAVAFDRRKLEAERDVSRAVGESGLDASLFGVFGLSNQATDFPGVYNNPGDQQRVRLGFFIPIVDWGRQKSRKKTAEANLKLVDFTVQQDEQNFDQEVLTQVRTFKMLKDQIVITQKADEISLRRYDISKNRYLIGKISITDLSLALTEKDNAKRTYITSLRNFWGAYYNLRRLTLHDFATNQILYLPED